MAVKYGFAICFLLDNQKMLMNEGLFQCPRYIPAPTFFQNFIPSLELSSTSAPHFIPSLFTWFHFVTNSQFSKL